MRLLILSLVLLIASPCWGGVDFAGTDQRIREDSGILTIASGTQSLTMSCWIKHDGSASNNIFGNGSLVVLDIESTDEARFLLNGFSTNDRVSSTSSPITTGVWHHVLGRYTSGGDLEIWVDGVLENSVTPTGSYSAGSTWQTSNLGEPTGSMTELAVWFSAISDNDIKNLASRVKRMPLQIDPDNLILYIPLDNKPNGTAGAVDLNSITNLANGITNVDEIIADSVWIAEEVLSYP